MFLYSIIKIVSILVVSFPLNSIKSASCVLVHVQGLVLRKIIESSHTALSLAALHKVPVITD